MIWKKKKDAPSDTPEAAAAAGAKKGGPLPFVKQHWKIILAVVCVAAAGGYFLLQQRDAKPANVDTSYVEDVPSRRDVSNTLSGTGTLNPANTYTVKSLVDGKILTAALEEGDVVDRKSVV